MKPKDSTKRGGDTGDVAVRNELAVFIYDIVVPRVRHKASSEYAETFLAELIIQRFEQRALPSRERDAHDVLPLHAYARQMAVQGHGFPQKRWSFH